MNQNLDYAALESLLELLKAKDYKGSLEDLQHSMQQASTESAGRQFWLYLGDVKADHPLRQWFGKLSRHFSDVEYRPSGIGSWSGSIELRARMKAKRRKARPVKEVSLAFYEIGCHSGVEVVARYYGGRKNALLRTQSFKVAIAWGS